MATGSSFTHIERVDFSRIRTSVPIPNLIELQKSSYERFLQMDLLRMVRCAADRGLETFTSTNGQFFGGEKIAAEVVASGLTELLVCLDGADQETISRYRKDANFDEIVAGIRRVLAARARLPRSAQWPLGRASRTSSALIFPASELRFRSLT